MSRPEVMKLLRARGLRFPARPSPCRVVESLGQPRSNASSNPVGTWLSLVEHSLGVRGVGSSNLPVPTNKFPSFSFRNLLDTRAIQPLWLAQSQRAARALSSCMEHHS